MTSTHPSRPLIGGEAVASGLRGRPAPRVLVAFAGGHGATRELAAGVARELVRAAAGRAGELTSFLAPVQRRPDVIGFDAVVVGSPVHGGCWPDPALRWVGDMSAQLRQRPVWLFSSGAPTLSPRGRHGGDGRWAADTLGAREHRFLGGDPGDRQALRDWCARIAAEVVGRRELVGAG